MAPSLTPTASSAAVGTTATVAAALVRAHRARYSSYKVPASLEKSRLVVPQKTACHPPFQSTATQPSGITPQRIATNFAMSPSTVVASLPQQKGADHPLYDGTAGKHQMMLQLFTQLNAELGTLREVVAAGFEKIVSARGSQSVCKRCRLALYDAADGTILRPVEIEGHPGTSRHQKCHKRDEGVQVSTLCDSDASPLHHRSIPYVGAQIPRVDLTLSQKNAPIQASGRTHSTEATFDNADDGACSEDDVFKF